MTKVDSNPGVAYTHGMIEETWEPTMHLRWILKSDGEISPVLHQLWRSNIGASRWRPVCTTDEITIKRAE